MFLLPYISCLAASGHTDTDSFPKMSPLFLIGFQPTVGQICLLSGKQAPCWHNDARNDGSRSLQNLVFSGRKHGGNCVKYCVNNKLKEASFNFKWALKWMCFMFCLFCYYFLCCLWFVCMYLFVLFYLMSWTIKEGEKELSLFTDSQALQWVAYTWLQLKFNTITQQYVQPSWGLWCSAFVSSFREVLIQLFRQ